VTYTTGDIHHDKPPWVMTMKELQLIISIVLHDMRAIVLLWKHKDGNLLSFSYVDIVLVSVTGKLPVIIILHLLSVPFALSDAASTKDCLTLMSPSNRCLQSTVNHDEPPKYTCI